MVAPSKGTLAHWRIANDQDQAIALIVGRQEECNANAKAIAAVPKLIAALERLELAASNRENVMGDPCRLIEVRGELNAAAAQARDALKEAGVLA